MGMRMLFPEAFAALLRTWSLFLARGVVREASTMRALPSALELKVGCACQCGAGATHASVLKWRCRKTPVAVWRKNTSE